MGASRNLIAREYLRVSLDRSGRMRSADEQHADNEEHASAEGWTLGPPYVEAGAVSASRYSRKARPGFDALTADLASGAFGADVLILWEPSRGSRRLSVWAAFLETVEDAGVLLHVTSHGRTYDLSRPRDRRSLQEDGTDSEYESGKMSDRISRAMEANAAAGLPHGPIPYGYRRKYAIGARGKRELLGQFPEPAEATVVRELFQRLRKGHTLKAIERDFMARGIRTRTGKPFTSQHLRDIALRPCYAGLRTHTAGTGSHNGRWRKSLDGAVPAAWPALVDPETFHAVRAMLNAPERRTSRPGRAKHLLSLIAVCDPCGGPLTATYRTARCREYECRDKSCVRIDADELDTYAETVMLAYLARDDVIAELRAGNEGPGSELAQVRGDLAAARAELASLRALAARPFGDPQRLSAASLATIEPGLIKQISDLEARERNLSVPPALAGLISPGKDVRRRWKAAPVSAQREVARMLCSLAILGQLHVTRAPVPGQRGPAAERVRWARG